MSHLRASRGAELARWGQAPRPRPSPTAPEATAGTWGCGADLSVLLGPSRKVTSPRNGREPCSRTPCRTPGHHPQKGQPTRWYVTPPDTRIMHQGNGTKSNCPVSAGRAGRGSQAAVRLCSVGPADFPRQKHRPEKEVAAPLLLLERPWKWAADHPVPLGPSLPPRALLGHSPRLPQNTLPHVRLPRARQT